MKAVVSAVVLALGAAFSGNALAQTKMAQEMPVKFFIGMGVTGSGDKLASVQYTDGSSATLRAGSVIQFHGGLEYRFNNQFSGSLGIGYHFDKANAANGDISFDRVPVELLAHYKVNEQFRIGGGVRLINSPELSSSGAAAGLNVQFKSTTGAVLEGEYLFSQKFGVKVRAVSEKYKVEGASSDVDGSHIGLFGNYYF